MAAQDQLTKAYIPGGSGAYYDQTTGQVVGNSALPAADRVTQSLFQSNPELTPGVRRVTAGNYGGTPGLADQETARYQGLADAADARGAPQMDLGAYNAQRYMDMQRAKDQGYALQQYRGMIEGTGPSLAALQMNARMGAANQQGAQMASGARGGGAGLAAMQNAGIGAAGQGSMAAMAQGGADRSAEAMGAMAGYGGLAYQQRGQDLAQLAQSQDLAFKQAGLDYDQRARNDQRNIAFARLGQGVTEQQTAAQQWREFANQGDFNAAEQMTEAQRQRDDANRDAVIGGVSSGVGAGLAGLGKREDDRKRGIV